jgi:hypothetical protein
MWGKSNFKLLGDDEGKGHITGNSKQQQTVKQGNGALYRVVGLNKDTGPSSVKTTF